MERAVHNFRHLQQETGKAVSVTGQVKGKVPDTHISFLI